MADQRFAGQTVMITGAAGGFGAEAARKFAALGARLALSDRDESGLEQIRTELQDIGADVWVEAYDVGNENETKAHVDQILERFGSLDIALNNAGICHDLKPLTQLAVEDLDRMFAVNVRGVFLGMKYQIPVMAKAGRGAIINMASAAGLVGAGMLSAYAASKHAVVGLTRSAADETGRSRRQDQRGLPVLCTDRDVPELFRSLGRKPEQAGQRDRCGLHKTQPDGPCHPL
jgi:NAD(P)-dependent dehydrogenase (short-subunit alcohol dehydrogenase family)